MKFSNLLLATVTVALSAVGACANTRTKPALTYPTTSSTNPSVEAAQANASMDLNCSGTTVFFSQGSADLTPQDQEQLRTLHNCLQHNNVSTLYIEGRTDPAGTETTNLNLGKNRAVSVAHYLMSMGSDVRFVVMTRGESGASQARTLWPYDRVAVTSTSTGPAYNTR
jgi:outer membrane protein OmpA-like peptidoglycan-associated protein